ncbi:MAG: ATP-binding protein, partial [Flavobacteriales bacterium]|nr:ATP-binding protein [Flavobacteriales bacterium]
RYSASLEQLDYHPERGLDRTIVQRLSTGHYITQAQNVLIMGSTGLNSRGEAFRS